MQNQEIILLSSVILGIVFVISLLISYCYQKFQNRTNFKFKFNWKKHILISLTYGIFVALLVALYYSCFNKEINVKLPTSFLDTSSFFKKSKESSGLKMKMGGCGCGDTKTYKMSCEF